MSRICRVKVTGQSENQTNTAFISLQEEIT